MLLTGVALFIITVLQAEWAFTYNVTELKSLQEQLFVNQSYDKRVRPVFNQSNATRLRFTLFLLSLKEIDITQQIMRLTAYLEVLWMDEFLQWNPDDFSSELETFVWPQNEVWKPVIALRNSHTKYEPFGDPELNVIVDSSGEITWITFHVFTSTCPMKVLYYPFDVQTCELKFVAWGYTLSEVTLEVENFDTLEYEPNPNWELLNVSSNVLIGDNDIAVVFYLKLRRVPTYVIFTVLLPVLLLVILNLFVFLLPCESGERVSYAVTVFLSFAVFFTMISSILPESVALLSVYVVVMAAQSVLICTTAIVQVRLCSCNVKENPIPKWLLAISRVGHCSFKTVRNNKIDEHGQRSEDIITELDDDLKEDDIKPQHNSQLQEPETWRKVISGLDYVLTITFTGISLTVTTTIIGICAAST